VCIGGASFSPKELADGCQLATHFKGQSHTGSSQTWESQALSEYGTSAAIDQHTSCILHSTCNDCKHVSIAGEFGDIQLKPKSTPSLPNTRNALFEAGREIGSKAREGDFICVEKDSEIEP
jgi:hypothetical protein